MATSALKSLMDFFARLASKKFYFGTFRGPEEQLICRGEGSWDGVIELNFINGRVSLFVIVPSYKNEGERLEFYFTLIRSRNK